MNENTAQCIFHSICVLAIALVMTTLTVCGHYFGHKDTILRFKAVEKAINAGTDYNSLKLIITGSPEF